MKSPINTPGRRLFIRNSALFSGAMLLNPMGRVYANTNKVKDEIKIALIGCGGRGTGAASQALYADKGVRLVAMVDPFKDRLDNSYMNLVKEHGKDRVDVPESQKYTDLDGYKTAMSKADLVILATPPGFRPMHFEEAVHQGKHVFMEKPVATDVPGVKKIMELSKQADEKQLFVMVGHHLRFQPSCIESVKRLKEGMIGDLIAMRAYFDTAGVWVRDRLPGQTEMEYQIWNWYYFNWLGGDHIVEQHVHDHDFINWVKGSHPVSAQGMGGREVRTGKEYGQIFDHHFVEYEYADGSIFSSQCRHIKGCWDQWADGVQGSNGSFFQTPQNAVAVFKDKKGNEIYKYNGKDDTEAHQAEQDVLFRRLRNDEYMNQAMEGATSTMTAILGRMATYSGQMITWDEAMKYDVSILPKSFDRNAEPPVLPDENGFYPIPVPGVTKYV